MMEEKTQGCGFVRGQVAYLRVRVEGFETDVGLGKERECVIVQAINKDGTRSDDISHYFEPSQLIDPSMVKVDMKEMAVQEKQ